MLLAQQTAIGFGGFLCDADVIDYVASDSICEQRGGKNKQTNIVEIIAAERAVAILDLSMLDQAQR